MTFPFHPAALAEYEEAALWYEEQRYLLGMEFAAAVEAAIASILEEPGRYQPTEDDTRVFRLKRFPYRLFYRFDAAAASLGIVAVMHEKRRPESWQGRL
ncbi:type II toxin-antitoxin system RelE/ParE family toxin [Luteolibacter sp. Populi]|uniref:type II toxin-antitoxin system RelE/ParE family toxin n=1 Tax=Luteolibacter sp. Populi TaxID=3230487 RepID=UPI0034655B54